VTNPFPEGNKSTGCSERVTKSVDKEGYFIE